MIVGAMCLVAACGDDGTGDDGVGDDGGDDGSDPFVSTMGQISIREQRGNWNGEDEPTTAIDIELTDAERYPYHQETGREGECRRLEWEAGADCGECDGVCAASGCVAWPNELDADAISLAGLRVPIEIVPDDVTGRYRYYPSDDPDLFEPGAIVSATAAGGDDVDGFDLAAPAPEPLETAIVSPLSLPHDAAFDVTWTPGSDGARVFLTIVSKNNGHGAPYNAVIECASADDGAITIPGAFVLALGPLSGLPCIVGNECPPAALTRYRRARTTTADGDVVLWVGSERVFYVSHDDE